MSQMKNEKCHKIHYKKSVMELFFTNGSDLQQKFFMLKHLKNSFSVEQLWATPCALSFPFNYISIEDLH